MKHFDSDIVLLLCLCRIGNVYMVGALSIFKNYFVFEQGHCARSTRQSNLLHLRAIRTEVPKRSFY